MNRFLLASLGVVAVVGVVTLRSGEAEIPGVDAEPRRYESLAVLLPDAGLAYASPQTVLADAGCVGAPETCVLVPVVVVEPTSICRRVMPDGGSCFWALPDGGDGSPLDPWLRLRQELVTGADCQQVACAVIAGQNPDQDEHDIAEPLVALPSP